MSSLSRVLKSFLECAERFGLPITLSIRGGVGRGLRLSPRNATREHIAGTCELPVQACLQSVLRPGDTFLDIGSNIGFFTLIAARLVGPTGRVYAVEPVPENIECLARNARLNRFDRVRLIEAAAGDADGEAELLLARHSGGATLSEADFPPDFRGRLRVPVTAVDSLVDSGRITAPSMVKIDVEGAELAVLKGMKHTLSTFRPIVVFEVDASRRDAAESKFRSIVGDLAALDYTVERLTSSYDNVAWTVVHGLARPQHRRHEVPDTRSARAIPVCTDDPFKPAVRSRQEELPPVSAATVR